MIGNPKWFQRRKYGGWGISPKTWQGWLYIAFILIPFIVFQALPYWTTETRIYVTVGWLLFLLFDVTHIMTNLDRDEREYKIEAIAERNASWVMALLIVAGLVYQIFSSALGQNIVVDPFLAAALFGGVIAKTVSNLVLEKRSM